MHDKEEESESEKRKTNEIGILMFGFLNLDKG